MQTDPSIASSVSFRQNGAVNLAAIAVGHGIKHWYVAAFPVFLPLIQQEYALTPFGVAVLMVLRQFGGGFPNFFVGYLTDRLHNYWHLLLPVSLFIAATMYFLAGLSPWYWPIAVLIALAGAGASIWHPPAISMLSARFPRRRGMAIAFHGAGSGAGEALGPLGVGIILTAMLMEQWRPYVIWAVLPALVLVGLLYWLLDGAKRDLLTHAENRRQARPADIFRLLRYPVYQTLAISNFARSFSHFGLLSFLPLYLTYDLGFRSAGVGSHVALLTLLGVVAGPTFGYFSDRTGRRLPLVVSFAAISAGMIAMGVVGSGIPLIVALALTGLFLWSIQDVINASAMDAAPPGNEGTVVGLMFASSFVAGVIAPLVAAAIVNLTGDRISVFYLSGAVMAPAALLLLFAPLTRTGHD